MSVQRKIVNVVVRKQKIFVGLEDSKKTWKICVRTGRQIVHEVSMPAKYAALSAYFGKHFPECDIHVIYEAGFKGFGLYYDLTSDGHACTVVPPHTVVQAKSTRVKNDRTDARLLAKNLEDGSCGACHVPDKERLADRQIVRSLNIVNKDIKQAKCRVRSFLFAHGIDSGVPDSAVWRDNHYKSLRTLDVGNPLLRECLDDLLDHLDFLWIKRGKYEKKLGELSKKERYATFVKIAKSFPGIGPLTAIRLVLELGEDLSRFGTGGEIASFVGLGGVEHSTGETERKGGITKQGNGMVRSWLIECAWIARKRDPALQVFYSRIMRNSGSGNKAITAVARKLITRLRSCVVNNTEYVLGVVQ